MKASLLAYLCCPCCAGDLALEIAARDGGEIMTGTLTCAACAGAYPIAQGVPRLVANEPTAVVRRNVDGFAYEWKRLASASPKYEEELRSYLGAQSPETLFRGHVVLEAGCGMGKFLGCVSRAGATNVVGVDLSASVEVAYRLTRHLPNVHVVQADIHALPFRAVFDVVYSIGVLHHLPDPRKGFEAIVKPLKSDGVLFAWVYGREGNEFFIRWIDPWRRLTCRLPHRVNEWLAKGLAGLLWLMIVLVYRPLNALGVRRLPLQEYFLYFHQLGFRFFWGTVLDKMIPPIAWYLRRDDVLRWLRDDLHMEVLDLSQRNGHSWRALSRKHVHEAVVA